MTITENTSIDYDVQGEGPPLLLINGLGFGRWGRFKQIPAFTRHFRTITFDVRGERGLSNGVADLTGEAVALLDHLGLGKTHVLGTSLGGFVAQELALARPDLVDRLVLVCTSYGGRGPEAATGEAHRAEKPEEFEQIVRWRLADSPSAVSYYEQAKAGARFDLSGDVGHITSPTLVIHGAEDRYVPPANARALAEAIPGAKLQMIEEAGHLVFVERFADVNRGSCASSNPAMPRRPAGPAAGLRRRHPGRPKGGREGARGSSGAGSPGRRPRWGFLGARD